MSRFINQPCINDCCILAAISHHELMNVINNIDTFYIIHGIVSTQRNPLFIKWLVCYVLKLFIIIFNNNNMY